MKGLKDSGFEGNARWNAASAALRAIAVDALAACRGSDAIARCCRVERGRLWLGDRSVALRGGGRLVLIAYGKAAPSMIDGVLAVIGKRSGGRTVQTLAIAPRLAGRHRSNRKVHRIRRLSGDHPVPLRASFRSGREALRLATTARPNDDVVFLASGGGSALMAAPLAPFLGPAEKSYLHRRLIVSGAPIGAINTVRKHVSAIKGGRLAAAARRARSQTTLVLCDVDPDHFEEVASGPSRPDPSTLDDMIRVTDRYGLPTALPDGVLEGLRAKTLPETPKPGDPIFRRTQAHLILSNRDLRESAVRQGLARGLAAEAWPHDLGGAVDSGVERVARAIEAAPPGLRLLVMGGEMVTAPTGPGRGGRAQELALRLALRMERFSMRPWAFLALGSDGSDGNAPAAGAFVDRSTLERARRIGLDPTAALSDSDSYRFFKVLGDAIVLPPTETNVRDLYLLLTGEARRSGRGVRSRSSDRSPSPKESGSSRSR